MNREAANEDRRLLICEELFMLLRSADGKPVLGGLSLGLGLSGAVVADLRQADRVALVGEKNQRVVVGDATPTHNPVLDAALERLVAKNERRLKPTIADRKLDPTKAVVAQLESYGMLVPHRRLVHTSYEVRGPRTQWRHRLAAAITGAPTNPRDTTLLGIIKALDAAKAVFPDTRHQLGSREFNRRLKAIADSVPEARTVEQVKTEQFASVTAVCT